jgi:hypothetical protein
MIFVHSLSPVFTGSFVDVCAGVLDHRMLSAEASFVVYQSSIDRTSRSGCRQSPDASSNRGSLRISSVMFEEDAKG